MTGSAVGARSGDPERARFIRALIASLLLHVLLLALKLGPLPGTQMPALPGGGVIEAVLRPPPSTASAPHQALEAGVQPALVSPTPETLKLPRTAEAASRPPAMAADAAGQRDEGREASPGAPATDSLAIPLLAPLPAQARELPRRPSLLAPLNFSFPPNVRFQGGRVRVRILLDDKGQVEEMRVVASAPPGVFDNAAVQVLRAGRFAPGFVGPMPLRSYLFMEVSFGPGPQGQQLWYAGSAMAPALKTAQAGP